MVAPRALVFRLLVNWWRLWARHCYQVILVPRAHDPSGLRLWEQPFQACAIDADCVKPDGQNSVISFIFSKWLLPEALDSCGHRPEGSWALGTRILPSKNVLKGRACIELSFQIWEQPFQACAIDADCSETGWPEFGLSQSLPFSDRSVVKKTKTLGTSLTWKQLKHTLLLLFGTILQPFSID